ncbi:MAG: hypothetical protein ACON5A_02915 [Candidatus Comchoanobacterales bacterium]
MDLSIKHAHAGEKNTTLEWHLDKEYHDKISPYVDHLVALHYHYRTDNKQLKVTAECAFKAHHKSEHIEVSSYDQSDSSAISLAKKISKLVVDQVRSYTDKRNN